MIGGETGAAEVEILMMVVVVVVMVVVMVVELEFCSKVVGGSNYNCNSVTVVVSFDEVSVSLG